jgi:hypothetical protein
MKKGYSKVRKPQESLHFLVSANRFLWLFWRVFWKSPCFMAEKLFTKRAFFERGLIIFFSTLPDVFGRKLRGVKAMMATGY